MATISVVIATFHRPEALEKTIRDLLLQTVLPKQIIVVDNSTTDERRKPKSFSVTGLVECIYLEATKEGFVNAARNEGLRRVTADYAVLMDDDMSLPRDLLENFLAIHEEGWDAVAGMVSERGVPVPSRPTTGLPFWNLVRHRHGTSRGHTIAVPSCLVSLRQKMLEEIGFLDEAFVYNYDDYDLGLRIWLGGFTLIQDPRANASHLKAPLGGSRKNLLGDERILNKYTAKYYFIHKHFGRRATRMEFAADLISSFANCRQKHFRVVRDLVIYFKAFRKYRAYGCLARHAETKREGAGLHAQAGGRCQRQEGQPV